MNDGYVIFKQEGSIKIYIVEDIEAQISYILRPYDEKAKNINMEARIYNEITHDSPTFGEFIEDLEKMYSQTQEEMLLNLKEQGFLK
jgi:hypothetical protein